MPQTPRFLWNTWAANQAQPNQTFNNALVPLDQLVGLSVISRTTAAQPGAPSNGDAYILPASPTGAAWGAFSENQVAYYYSDGTTASWYALTPPRGLRARVQDVHDAEVYFDGSAWQYAGAITVRISGLADDAVHTIDFGDSVFSGQVIVSGNQDSTNARYGIFSIRAATTPYVVAIVAGSGITLSTGIHTGTTGVDGNMTLATHSDGTLYLENRTGLALTMCMTVIFGSIGA